LVSWHPNCGEVLTPVAGAENMNELTLDPVDTLNYTKINDKMGLF